MNLSSTDNYDIIQITMTSSKIKDKAHKLGLLGCGIIPSNTLGEYKIYLDERVKSFPGSKDLYEPLYDFARLPENAKSIIVCTQRYNRYKIPESLKGLIGKCYLFDPRIPYSEDYRATLEFEAWLKLLGVNILQCGIPVRLAAAKAGLGKLGRNNFLFDPVHGSYIWINAWVTDKELEYDDVEKNITMSACNDGCQKCVSSCSTKALSGAFSMNRGLCTTQLSCWAKDELDEDTGSQMGLWLYGCDECQDVCPQNKDKFTESEEYPLLRELEEYLKPERILEMDEETYLNIVNPRFWYMGKDNLQLWKNNAHRNLKNSGHGTGRGN